MAIEMARGDTLYSFAGRPAPGPTRPVRRRYSTSSSPASAIRSRWKAASFTAIPACRAASSRPTGSCRSRRYEYSRWRTGSASRATAARSAAFMQPPACVDSRRGNRITQFWDRYNLGVRVRGWWNSPASKSRVTADASQVHNRPKPAIAVTPVTWPAVRLHAAYMPTGKTVATSHMINGASHTMARHQGDNPPSAMLGHGEEHGRVVDGLERVPGRRHDEEVARGALPGHLSGFQADPSMQHMHGGLARVFVLVQHATGGERDDRLAQHMLVAAIDRPRAPAA